MSRHEGTYVLRRASQLVGRGWPRENYTDPTPRRAVSGPRRARGIIRRGPAGTRDGARGTIACVDVLLIRDTSRELPWPTGPNVRGQMAAHGENLRQFLRICDVFPRNPRKSVTIFGSPLLWRTTRPSTTTSDQLSDRRTTTADSPSNTVSQAPSSFSSRIFPRRTYCSIFSTLSRPLRVRPIARMVNKEFCLTTPGRTLPSSWGHSFAT